MAFDFPDTNGLANGFRVTNPKTGTEYAWQDASQKWVLVNSGTTGDYVKKAGDIMSGPLMMLNGDPINPEPIDIINDEQAVHKFYVEERIEEFLPDLTDDSQQIDTIDERYVNKKGGDSMQGPLNVTGGRNANTDGLEGTVKALNIDSGGTSSLNLKWGGKTRVYIGDTDFTLVPNLKFNAGGKAIYAGNDKKGFVVNTGGVFYDGDYIHNRHVATKQNVEEAVFADPTDPDSNKFVKIDGDVMTGDLEAPNITVDNDVIVKNDATVLNDINLSAGATVNTASKVLTFNDNGIFYEGQYIADKHLVTKKNLDESIFLDPSDPLSNIYVDRGGDTMEGQLEMTKAAGIKFTGLRDGNKAIEVGRNTAEFPTLINLNHPGGSTLGGYDIKIGGNTNYNELRILGGSNAAVPSVTFKGNGIINVFKNAKFNNNKITQLADATDDKDAVPYGQVKKEVQDAFDKILSVGAQAQYTVWNSNSLVAGFMFPRSGSSNLALRPSTITHIEFHKTDLGGLEAAFDTLKDGDRLVLVDVDNSHVSKYRIDDPPTVSGDKYIVKIASGEGDDLELSHNVQLFFQEFDVGVDLDDYLKLDASNDPLTGNLEINQGVANREAGLKLTGDRPNASNASATITFENTKSTEIGYLTYRAFGAEHYFKFNQDLDLGNNGLHSVGRIRMQPGGAIEANNNPRLLFKTAGDAKEGEGLLEVPRPSDNRRGFTIRGKNESGTETDLLYTYTNAGGPDAVNYVGKQDGPTNIVTLATVKELIGSGNGTGAGEVIQTHGPWEYKAAGSSVSPGEWTTDVTAPRKVKQITFHNKDSNGEDVDWSDLMPGEVITIVQSGDFSSVGGPTDAWSMINYEVTEFQIFGTATIIDVNCHWTYVVFSTGAVQYNPSEAFGFLTDTDTYVLESQPATLNNVVHMAKKTTVAPAFYSFSLIANTVEPLLGIRPGQMVMSGGSTIQAPNSILIAGTDEYGNGIQNGSNTLYCPGSRVSLWRKNLDGSICLCRSYQFNTLASVGNGSKIRFTDLTKRYEATNGTPTIPSPGVMEAGAQYLLSYELDFKISAYTIDEEGDPHYGDHRLEDVGHPEAATDAATKGYVDDKFLMKTGGTMTGPLNFSNEADGVNYSLEDQAYLQFTTTNFRDDTRVAGIFQTGYSGTLKSTGDFMSGGNVYTSSSYNAGISTGNVFKYYAPSLKLTEDKGYIKYGNQKTLMEWDGRYVNFPNVNAANVNAPGFSIEGKTSNTSNSKAFFYVNHNKDEPDEIHYNGRTTSASHIANKRYVDAAVANSGGGGSSPIQIVPGTPENVQVGDAWFSTNQNTFIIKIS